MGRSPAVHLGYIGNFILENFTVKLIAYPSISMRAIYIWRRNFFVWKKLAIGSLLGNLADPMIYLFGLGYGLGGLLPQINGVSYIAFLGSGTVCASTMNAASFEALYSTFSRMHDQRTWEAIMNAPIALEDVMSGELLWAASKAMLSGTAMLIVLFALGIVTSPMALWALPVIFLAGLTFASLGLIATMLASSYDFFMFYFTLFVTPMMMLSGVFFPLDQMPSSVQVVSGWLPLTHVIALVRPLLLSGEVPVALISHAVSLFATSLIAFWIAVILGRRRFLQ
ncbi:ABC-2 type transporter, NodJ family [Gallionella capsiferriformans ES-2]|uniref:Transport permease protein n=1 Tax=Gallionella capsiferriformans (strain ES-2) TaxID=395494 RepID=D9SDF9_GALCS|nr:ABC-2 type transporter, NodJ family [Gallionella capsiferriformans ES-2]